MSLLINGHLPKPALLNHTRIRYSIIGLNLGLFLLSSLYLWQIFIQPDRDFVLTYPASNPALFWTPYTVKPETGFFGFPHRAGWKAVGTLYENGTLEGDYDSNIKVAVTSWYTRHAPRSCNEAEFYIIDKTVAEPVPFRSSPDETGYTEIGQITPGPGGLEIRQITPPSVNLDQLNYPSLADQFDATAQPAAFTPNFTWSHSSHKATANFSGLIKLNGYDLDQRRAYPGGRLFLTLYWEGLTPIDTSYTVFTQLDPDKKYAQADGIPYCTSFPTTLWQPGNPVPDHHVLNINPETPPGVYDLVVGWYDVETGRQLDILDVAGNPAGIAYRLTQVEIGP